MVVVCFIFLVVVLLIFLSCWVLVKVVLVVFICSFLIWLLYFSFFRLWLSFRWSSFIELWCKLSWLWWVVILSLINDLLSWRIRLLCFIWVLVCRCIFFIWVVMGVLSCCLKEGVMVLVVVMVFFSVLCFILVI